MPAACHNSEWHVTGLLLLRSRLSAGPGHPAVIRDSAIGLGTTQNTRRLRSRLSGGFWPLLLANETPRVRTGTTQNTRRPVAAWACGFWPPSPVNKAPRVVTLARSEYPLPRRLGVRFRASGSPWTGLPFSSGTLRDQRIPSGSAEVRARLESDRRDLPSPTPRYPEGWNLARSESNESPRVPRTSPVSRFLICPYIRKNKFTPFCPYFLTWFPYLSLYKDKIYSITTLNNLK